MKHVNILITQAWSIEIQIPIIEKNEKLKKDNLQN